MQDIIIDFGVFRILNWTIPLRIHGYGLMLVLGFLTGMYIAQWRARRSGENPDAVAVCGILALVGGIAGSRIAYVIQHWETQFAPAPSRIAAVLNLTSGGLIYYGGVITAVVLVIGYLVVRKRPVRRYLDFLAVPLMVGLAFGRGGCFLHGCCYGAPARPDWPLSITFPMYSKPLIKVDGRVNPYSQSTGGPTPPYSHQLGEGQIRAHPALVAPEGGLIPPQEFTPEQIAIAASTRTLPVYPAQLLGIANASVLAILLSFFYRLRRREGQVFALMLMAYSVSRFVLELIRDDNQHDLSGGILTHNQYTSIAVFAAGAIMLLVIQKLSPWVDRAKRQKRTVAPKTVRKTRR